LRCNSHKGPNLSGYHPPNQEVTIRTVDADHPLVAAFQGRERKRGAKKGRRPILVLPGGENGGEDGDTAFLQPPPPCLTSIRWIAVISSSCLGSVGRLR
jgi:hypothetical protein